MQSPSHLPRAMEQTRGASYGAVSRDFSLGNFLDGCTDCRTNARRTNAGRTDARLRIQLRSRPTASQGLGGSLVAKRLHCFFFAIENFKHRQQLGDL
jgi:hypothetical protein